MKSAASNLRELSDPPASARTYEEAVLIAGGPVRWPREPHIPDIAHIRSRMPKRSDRHDFLLHALRFFEDVLDYAERLNEEANGLVNRAEAADAKLLVFEAALRKIANGPPDRGLTPDFRQFARDVLEPYDRG